MRRLVGPTLLSLSYTRFDSKEDSRPHKYDRRCPSHWNCHHTRLRGERAAPPRYIHSVLELLICLQTWRLYWSRGSSSAPLRETARGAQQPGTTTVPPRRRPSLVAAAACDYPTSGLRWEGAASSNPIRLPQLSRSGGGGQHGHLFVLRPHPRDRDVSKSCSKPTRLA
jgi:hypothetical protein